MTAPEVLHNAHTIAAQCIHTAALQAAHKILHRPESDEGE